MPFPYIVLFTSVDMVYPLWCITCLCSIWTLKNYCLTFHSYSGERYRAIMALLFFFFFLFVFFFFFSISVFPLTFASIQSYILCGYQGSNFHSSSEQLHKSEKHQKLTYLCFALKVIDCNESLKVVKLSETIIFFVYKIHIGIWIYHKHLRLHMCVVNYLNKLATVKFRY